MFSKLTKNSGPKSILIISQTNIGDVVLTCPVIDILRRDFPKARIDIVTGPKAVSLFADNPNFRVKVFDKRASLPQRITWFLDLYHEHYDCVVDLRRTALALFLWPRYATPVLAGSHPKGHKKESHLDRLRQVYGFDAVSNERCSVLTTREDKIFFEGALAPVLKGQDFVVMAPGAADSSKRWHPNGFAALEDHLSARHKIIFVGDAKDAQIVDDIQGQMKASSLSLAGKVNLRQLAFVLKKSSWAVTHDSGVMHLACYLDVPVVVLWGPTDISKYAPWSSRSVIVRRNEKCIRCLDPKSRSAVQDVIEATERIQR